MMNSRSDDPGDGFYGVSMENQTPQGFQFMGSWVPITPMKVMQGSGSSSSLVGVERVMHQEVRGGGYGERVLCNNGVERVMHQEANGGYRERVLCNNGGERVMHQEVLPSGGYGERMLCNNAVERGMHQEVNGERGLVQDLNFAVQGMDQNGGFDYGVVNGDRMMSLLGGSCVQGKGNSERDGVLGRSSVASPLPVVVRNNIGNAETVNGNFTSGAGVVNGSVTQSGGTQGGYAEFDLDDLMNPNQMPFSFTSLLSGGDNIFQTPPQYGTPARSRPLYNLNSPPRGEAVGSVCESSVQSVLSTPVQSVLSTPGLCRTGQANGIQETVITPAGHQITEQRSDKSMHSIVDSPAVNSTEVTEQKDESRRNELGFDLNEAPQPKVTKRRKKFMPKVIVEGKPKRKPRKPATQENVKAKETGSGKRKKGQTLKESAAKKPAANVGDMSNTAPELPLKSCKKALNFDLEKTGDVRQGDSESEVVQNASGSSSFSETRNAAGGTSGGCLNSVTQLDQTNGLVATNQPLEASIGCQSGYSSTGAKLPRVLQAEHTQVLAREQQPELLIGNQQSQLPVAPQNTHIPMGNHQPWLQMKNQHVRLPFNNQQPHMTMRNQQPHLAMGNQQPMYLMGTQRPALASGNQQPGGLQGNTQSVFINQQMQHACLPAGYQQHGSPAGMQHHIVSAGGQQHRVVSAGGQQHHVVSAGGQQHGLLMNNQQSGVLLRNQQSELLMRSQQLALMRSQQRISMMNQQSGSSMRSQSHVPVMNQQPGSSMRSQSHVPMMNQQPGSSMRSQSQVPLMNQQHGTPKGFTHLNQMVAACMSSPGLRHQSPAQPPATHLHVESVSRGLIGTAGTCQRSSIPEYGSLQQDVRQGNGYNPYQGRSTSESVDVYNTTLSQNSSLPTPVMAIEAGVSKRQYDRAMGQTQNHDLNSVARFPLLQQISHLQDVQTQNSRMSAEHSDAARKMKMQNGVQEKLHGMPPEVIRIDDDPTDGARKDKKTASTRGSLSVVQKSAENEKCNVLKTPAKKVRATKKKSVSPPANASAIQLWEPTPAKTPSSRGKAKGKKAKLDSGKSRGPGEHVYEDPMAEIISRLENLILAERSREQEQNALVVYNAEGAVVPYETKKRKPRPKVDLDEETNRIWNLLMGKGEGDEDLDKKKEKWWEEERRVFRGRADSFIARMHLVQGDRRFSPWKGSVVDSVIGVFLTQNVSDHLSSSAFMSLAARFPPKRSTEQEAERNVRGVVVEDPEGCILNLNDIPTWQEKVPHPSDGQVSGVDNGSKEQQKDCSSSGQSSEEDVFSSQDSFDPAMFQSCGGVGSCSGSKSDSESPIRTVTGSAQSAKSGSPSLSDGDVQIQGAATVTQKKPDSDKPMTWKDSAPFVHPSNLPNLQTGPTRPSSSYEHSTVQKPQIPDMEDFGMQGEGTGHSWLSMSPRAYTGKNKNSPRRVVRKGGKSTAMGMFTSTSTQQDGSPQLLESFMDLLNSSEECLTRQSSPNTGENVIGPLNNNTSLQNILSESNSSNKAQTVIDFKETNSTIVREMKGTLADGKKPTSHWDSLRTDVEAKKGKQPRSKDSLDSIDYEAIRRASVKEISDSIKERGMNNMLAVRIKDFLERIVKDHGAVDLEWLRDAPADKAKDYLLSIRGLGLKSVECVRLLTLHNLAFPVDTNVGRIAVRLGWVPLQPLPESLQLHLLELYPVLESIQKFLWPRLCNLDQRTLYELHYQLITFGKVFCTKSRPNCNACPMRGECRHFASAYASARLALPAPDEKSLTTASVPVPPQSFPPTPIRMMELPPPLPEKSLSTQGPSNSGNCEPIIEAPSNRGNCEPIIEEPASPEPEVTEITESDIDYAYYNVDPDEIPTIELNINQFGTTLREHFRTMELQEGDMSRALVTLNPATTHIPIPKLKNISRLRTEHQVYELPDSHPLLDKMDKREPDDPSHYLLAIWTPGETANSAQPPEQKCGGKASGKMCFAETCIECSSVREANSQTVRGTLLVPCRTAMRGSFPLNGTYFQVNEVFADHDSSLKPIDVPRKWLWNLPRRTVFFGTSVTSIFRGLTTEQIQYCFWKGFVCVRGFEQATRAPRPLRARLHFPASKAKNNKAGQ